MKPTDNYLKEIDMNIKGLSELIEGLSQEDAKEFVRKLILEDRQKVHLEIGFINGFSK